jgi:hypothetical protein
MSDALQRRLKAAALLIDYRTMTPEDRAEEIRKKYRPDQHTLDELQKMIEDEITAAVTEVLKCDSSRLPRSSRRQC